MPAMHTCFGQRFVEIMDCRVIKAGDPDVAIGKSANFLFYGKPSYRPAGSKSYSKNLRSSLLCFVIDLNKIGAVDSDLPFDSGGFDLWADNCGSAKLNEFYLPDDVEAAGRFVSAFYGENKRYYKTSLRKDIDDRIGEFDTHSQSIVEICRPKGNELYDQRASTVEMHVASDIVLNEESVLAIAVPDIVSEADEMINFASELKADLIPYEFDLDDINSHQAIMKLSVAKWLSDNGYIKK
jgi:hypothetical protein